MTHTRNFELSRYNVLWYYADKRDLIRLIKRYYGAYMVTGPLKGVYGCLKVDSLTILVILSVTRRHNLWAAENAVRGISVKSVKTLPSNVT